MAKIINARDAASLTQDRAQQIEAKARQNEADRKSRAAMAARQARLWKAQADIILQAALNGKLSANIGSRLIDADRLIEYGFEVAIIDIEKLNYWQELLNWTKVEDNRALLEAARHLEDIANEKALDFIELAKRAERYKGMTVTKENVIRCFSEKIQGYRETTRIGKQVRNELFFHLFDGHLYLYQPIDSLKHSVQVLQDALHELYNAEKEIPEVLRGDYELSRILTTPTCTDESAEEIDIPTDFKEYLRQHEVTSQTTDINADGYFQIEWSSLSEQTKWTSDELISAKSMRWLAGKNGQELLSLIQSEINEAIHSAQRKVTLTLKLSRKNWTCDFDSPITHNTPNPDQLARVLKILNYGTTVSYGVEDLALLEVSWAHL
jgi:hypothetical protein